MASTAEWPLVSLLGVPDQVEESTLQNTSNIGVSNITYMTE